MCQIKTKETSRDLLIKIWRYSGVYLLKYFSYFCSDAVCQILVIELL